MKKVFLFVAGVLLIAGCNQDELLTTQNAKNLPFSDQVVSVVAPAISFDEVEGSELRMGLNASYNLFFEVDDAIGFYKYDAPYTPPFTTTYGEFGANNPANLFEFKYAENSGFIIGDETKMFRNASGKDFREGVYAAFHPYSKFGNITVAPNIILRIYTNLAQRQVASGDFSHLSESAVLFSSANDMMSYTDAATAHVIGVKNQAIKFEHGTSFLYFNIPAGTFQGGIDEQLLQIKVTAVHATEDRFFSKEVWGRDDVNMEDYWVARNAIPLTGMPASTAFVAQHSKVIGYSGVGNAVNEVVLNIGEAGERGCKVDEGFVAIMAIAINPARSYAGLTFDYTLRTTEGLYKSVGNGVPSSNTNWFVPGKAYAVANNWGDLEEEVWDGCDSEEVIPVDGVYSIYTPCQLGWVATKVNSGFSFSGDTIRLESNINLGRENAENWIPIGIDLANSFKGTFDGNGKIIKELYIDTPPSSGFAGLFGYNMGTIKNVTLTGVEITSGTYVGSVAGCNNGKPISKCTVEAIDLKGGHVGGIVGLHYGAAANITGSEVVGEENIINATSNAGGIAGLAQAGSLVEKNTASATITGALNAGGVVGKSQDAGNLVVNCSFSGEVKGANVGGVVGDNAGTIEQCAIGAMGASVDETTIIATTNGGGIVGTTSGKIVACANPGVAVNSGTNAGGVAGLNSGDIGVCYSSGSTLLAPVAGSIAGKNESAGQIHSVVTDITGMGICGVNDGVVDNGIAQGGTVGAAIGLGTGTTTNFGDYSMLVILPQSGIEIFLANVNASSSSKLRRSAINPDKMYVWGFDASAQKFKITTDAYYELIVVGSDYETTWIPYDSRYATTLWKVVPYGLRSSVLQATVAEATGMDNRDDLGNGIDSAPSPMPSGIYFQYDQNRSNYQGRYYVFTNSENTTNWKYSADLYISQEMLDGDVPFHVSFWGECRDASDIEWGATPIIAFTNVIEDGATYHSGYLPQDILDPEWVVYNSNNTGSWKSSTSTVSTIKAVGWHTLEVYTESGKIIYTVDGYKIGEFTPTAPDDAMVLRKLLFYNYNFTKVLDESPWFGHEIADLGITGYSFDAYFSNAKVSLFAK